MAMYAAFLRGINVGGHRVSKDRLIAVFEDLGFESVSTFRASGNVLFEASAAKPEPEPIESALEAALGYEVPTFLRSSRQVAKIAAREPFTAKQRSASQGKLQVAFLHKRPSNRAAAQASELAVAAEPVTIEGKELCWLPKGSMRDSELDLAVLERAVGPWTMRTMGTVEQIAAKLEG